MISRILSPVRKFFARRDDTADLYRRYRAACAKWSDAKQRGDTRAMHEAEVECASINRAMLRNEVAARQARAA
jgi:hypothetical protein